MGQARLYDVSANGQHHISVIGALQNEAGDSCGGCQPSFPGEAPAESTVNYSKGLIVGYTAAIHPTLVSNFHYGFIRESLGTIGEFQPAVGDLQLGAEHHAIEPVSAADKQFFRGLVVRSVESTRCSLADISRWHRRPQQNCGLLR